MNALKVLASTFVLTIGLVQVTNNVMAEDKNSAAIENFSTEEIVAEYHRRLNTILDNKATPFSDAFAVEAVSGELSDKEMGNLKSQLNEILSALRPFAEAGDKVAISNIALYELIFGPIFGNNTCENIETIRNAVQLGDYEGGLTAQSLASHLESWSKVNAPESVLFWNLEAQRRSPEQKSPMPFLPGSKITEVPDETLIKWAKWSPQTDPALAEIERICSD